MEQRGEMTKLLLKSFKDAIDYNNFLYTEEVENINIDAVNLELMYAAVAITIWKDFYITKKGEEFSSSLIDYYLDNYVTGICDKVDDKYYIGTIEFDNPIHVVDYLRNKLAHGDFVVVGDKIKIQKYITENKNKILYGEGYVDIKRIIALSSDLSFNWRNNKKYGNNQKEFVINTNAIMGKLKIVRNKRDIINALKNMYLVVINEKPKVLLQMRDNEYIEKVNYVIGLYKNKVYGCKTYKEICDVTDGFIEYASFYGIDLEIQLVNGLNIENNDKIVNKCLNDKEIFMKGNSNYQHVMMSNYLYDLGVNNDAKLDISKGILNNLYYLSYLEKNSDATLQEIIKYGTNNIMRLMGCEHDKAIISSYLASFYIIYVYGLERLYTGKEESKDSLKGIYDLNLFNFAELNLSSIKPKINVIEHEYKYFKDELVRMIGMSINTEELDQAKSEYEAFKKNVPDLCTDKLKCADKMYRDKIECLSNQHDYYTNAVLSLTEFMINEFDNYKVNRAIIEHIRNAIVHGNVYIDMFTESNDVLDSVITFKDVFKEETTFELEITARDFLSLFSSDNLGLLTSYLEYNLPSNESEKKLTLVYNND